MPRNFKKTPLNIKYLSIKAFDRFVNLKCFNLLLVRISLLKQVENFQNFLEMERLIFF